MESGSYATVLDLQQERIALLRASALSCHICSAVLGPVKRRAAASFTRRRCVMEHPLTSLKVCYATSAVWTQRWWFTVVGLWRSALLTASCLVWRNHMMLTVVLSLNSRAESLSRGCAEMPPTPSSPSSPRTGAGFFSMNQIM